MVVQLYSCAVLCENSVITNLQYISEIRHGACKKSYGCIGNIKPWWGAANASRRLPGMAKSRVATTPNTCSTYATRPRPRGGVAFHPSVLPPWEAFVQHTVSRTGRSFRGPRDPPLA